MVTFISFILYNNVDSTPLTCRGGDGRNVDRDDAELLRVRRGSQWDESTSYQDNPDF